VLVELLAVADDVVLVGADGDLVGRFPGERLPLCVRKVENFQSRALRLDLVDEFVLVGFGVLVLLRGRLDQFDDLGGYGRVSCRRLGISGQGKRA
jgi:hypothetical protein